MGMFPVFIIGFCLGIIVMAVRNIYKTETPSEVQLNMLKAEVIRKNIDIETLSAINEGLEEELEKVKRKLNEN